jgi:hypothetical protein
MAGASEAELKEVTENKQNTMFSFTNKFLRRSSFLMLTVMA